MKHICRNYTNSKALKAWNGNNIKLECEMKSNIFVKSKKLKYITLRIEKTLNKIWRKPNKDSNDFLVVHVKTTGDE